MVSVKSVVVGLHSWLPDAMEGPTSVSAVIHAATLVVAGVLMVSKVLLLLWACIHTGEHPLLVLCVLRFAQEECVLLPFQVLCYTNTGGPCTSTTKS